MTIIGTGLRSCYIISSTCGHIRSSLIFQDMKHMAILAIVLGTVLASSLFLLSGTSLRAEATVKDANQVDKFLSISNTSTEVKRWWNGEQTVSLMDSKVKVRADIPLDGLSGTFGYAWLTDDLNNVLALVSHLPIDESSYEMPGPGLYTYVLDMKARDG